jgi:uncharacterized membrane protein YkvA (DUF1232 family)
MTPLAQASGDGMATVGPLFIAVGATALLWAAGVALLVLAGRRTEARALARLIPDCAVVLRRLLGDDRVPRRAKLLLAASLAYLAVPVDLVPDVIPVAGQLDDAIVVALAIRWVGRTAGPAVVRDLWPGPPESLAVLGRLLGRA